MTDRTPRHFNENDELTSDVNNKSVCTERTETETLGFDYSDTYPQSPRQPEAGGPPAYKPHPGASNPVLTAGDVTDGTNPVFVADPFIVYNSGTYHMFFEVKEDAGGQWIGHATSPDGLAWTYDQQVLSTDRVYSYSQVFKHEGTWYMVPSQNSGGVEIWEATTFPTDWNLVETALTGQGRYDPTVFKFDDVWYLYHTENTTGPVRLFYSDTLLGDNWTEHPNSPLPGVGKPGGRPIVAENHVETFWQRKDDSTDDEIRVYCFRLSNLSKTTFSFSEVGTSPVLQGAEMSADFWNSDLMHHIDELIKTPSGSSIAAVDGLNAGSSTSYSIGIYTRTNHQSEIAHAIVPTSQAIAVSTEVDAQFQVGPGDAYDYTNQFDDTTYEYVVPKGGMYEISGNLNFQPNTNADGQIQARIISNEKGSLGRSISNIGYIERSGVTLPSKAVHLSEGERIKVAVYQNIGSDVTLDAGRQTFFQVKRMD